MISSQTCWPLDQRGGLYVCVNFLVNCGTYEIISFNIRGSCVHKVAGITYSRLTQCISSKQCVSLPLSANTTIPTLSQLEYTPCKATGSLWQPPSSLLLCSIALTQNCRVKLFNISTTSDVPSNKFLQCVHANFRWHGWLPIDFAQII